MKPSQLSGGYPGSGLDTNSLSSTGPSRKCNRKAEPNPECKPNVERVEPKGELKARGVVPECSAKVERSGPKGELKASIVTKDIPLKSLDNLDFQKAVSKGTSSECNSDVERANRKCSLKVKRANRKCNRKAEPNPECSLKVKRTDRKCKANVERFDAPVLLFIRLSRACKCLKSLEWKAQLRGKKANDSAHLGICIARFLPKYLPTHTTREKWAGRTLEHMA